MSFLSPASGAPPEQAPESIAGAPPEPVASAPPPADPLAAAPEPDAPSPVEPLPAPIDEALVRARRDQDDMALFAGANFAAFLKMADDQPGARRVAAAICWPGLLFPTPWFLYRKTYGLAAITVFTPVLLSLVHLPAGILRWVGLVAGVLGAFGKPLYRVKARRAIAAIRAAAPDEASARQTIARAGGVSNAGAIFGLLLLIAFLAFADLRP